MVDYYSQDDMIEAGTDFPIGILATIFLFIGGFIALIIFVWLIWAVFGKR